MTKPHTLQCRVYYEDTDAAGIIYHPNFLKFAERARTEALRAGGYDHHQVKAEFGLVIVVKLIEIDFKATGKLDDLLDVVTEVVAQGNTSLTMRQTISRGSTVLAVLKVVLVAITPEGRPSRWPPQLRQIFLPISNA
ncbi:MAG: YbgC/FadM family acyl-CoA thioesterase [Alphaproteobacteria bacterium]